MEALKSSHISFIVKITKKITKKFRQDFSKVAQSGHTEIKVC